MGGPRLLGGKFRTFVFSDYGRKKTSCSQEIPTGRQDDRERMLQRVAQYGRDLQFATEELRGDREVVMTAVAQDWEALEFATEELRGDREVVMTAVAQSGLAMMQYATEELRGDREVVMTAVAQTGWALTFATEELRGDREVVMTAVAQDGVALTYATEELRGDREVMEAALAELIARGHEVVGLKARLIATFLVAFLWLRNHEKGALRLLNTLNNEVRG